MELLLVGSTEVFYMVDVKYCYFDIVYRRLFLFTM